MKFAGVNLDEPRIMGVINVSPESFYKGSVRNDEKAWQKPPLEWSRRARAS